MIRLFGTNQAGFAPKAGRAKTRLVIDPPLEEVLRGVTDGLVFVGADREILFANQAAHQHTENDPSRIANASVVEAVVDKLRHDGRTSGDTEVDIDRNGVPMRYGVSVVHWPLGAGHMIRFGALPRLESGSQGSAKAKAAAGVDGEVDIDALLGSPRQRVTLDSLILKAWQHASPLAAERRARVVLVDEPAVHSEVEINESVVTWAIAECIAYSIRAWTDESGIGHAVSRIELHPLMSGTKTILAIMHASHGSEADDRSCVKLKAPKNSDQEPAAELGKRFRLARWMLRSLGYQLDKVRGDDGREVLLIQLTARERKRKVSFGDETEPFALTEDVASIAL